jgi:hypothetical protein
MFNDRSLGKKRPNDGAPFGEQRAVAEIDCVVLERLPIDHQKVAAGRFNAALHARIVKTLGAAHNGNDPVLDGLLEFSLAIRIDAEVSVFKNHCGGVQREWKKAD